MNKKTKRWILAGGGTTAIAVIVTAAVVLWSGDAPVAVEAAPKQRVGPEVVAQQFVTALATGQAAQAAAVTDAAGPAGAAITKTRQGMAGATYQARLAHATSPPEGTTTVTIDADVTWTLPGGVPFAHRTGIEMRLVDDQWRVHWSPALLHPQLTEGQSLAYTTTSGDGALLDRTGAPVAQGFAPLVMDTVRQAVGPLAGTPGWEVAVVDAAGARVSVLQEQKAQVTQSMTVTLDPKVQAAAQAAVDQVGQAAAVVALQPSSGEILAVAQNDPADGVGRIALENWFEPGSTFKVVTATAALSSGSARADTPVACPGKATIGTRRITNEDSFDLGTVPLHRAFAASCNTSFSRLAADLPADALPNAARYFGLMSDFTVAGITTNTGKIVPAESVPERVEAGIGQGDVLATPFGMALVAATVANGRTPVPRLIREIPTEGQQPAPLPGGITSALRSMMGEVVTGGTARELAGFGVRGKTGTAQFGDGSQAHGWFIGYRGDLAFAVLVLNGGSSKVAVSASATFLAGL